MTFDIEIAARTVWAEARGEGELGMRAVAWAIVNRHDVGKWFSGETLAECCLMKYQFSCWLAHDPNYTLIARLPDDDRTLDECRGFIQAAMLAAGDDPTEGATHYANLDVCSPAWAANATVTVKIGHHKFFKGVA